MRRVDPFRKRITFMEEFLEHSIHFIVNESLLDAICCQSFEQAKRKSEKK